MNRIQLPFYAKLAFVLLALVLMAYIAYLGQEILAPMMFALLFAILLLPLVSVLEKIHLPRAMASLVSVILLISAIALLLYFVATQVGSLTQDWPQMKKQLNSSFQRLQDWVDTNYHINVRKQNNLITSATEKIASSSFIGSTVVSVSSTVLFIIFIPIYTFFLLYYRALLVKFLVSLFAEQHISKVYDVLKQIKYIVKRYVLGLFLEMCVMAILLCGIFSIIGIKYAILLGLITALLNIIPYVGIYSSLALSAFLTFASTGPSKALLVAIIMVLVHILDSNVLMPRIVGSKVKINALITIIGVITGSLLWGVSGMFLAIPTIAILKIIFDRVDGLAPWGLLLSDDTKPESIRIKTPRLKIRRQEKNKDAV